MKIKKEKKMRTVKFKVEAMHCDGCARIIQSLLEKKTGLRAADVSFNDREALILDIWIRFGPFYDIRYTLNFEFPVYPNEEVIL
jgi:copper chaperone CopZ